MKSFKRIVLPNGLRIILAPQPGNLAATVLVKVEAGSKYETKKISGVSHFLEHLCFKGTKKRPTALAITSELESLGASYNAFTGQEITGYYAQVQSGKLDVVLDVISDMYLNPIFDSKEIEKEKGVIIEELNMYEDMPMRKVGDVFMELLYGDQPAGWDIGGNKDAIRLLNRDDIVDYRSKHYVAQATTVVVAGSFDEKKVLDAIGKMFAKMPVTKKYPKEKTLDIQKNPAVALKFKESDQAHIILGFRAFDMYDKRRYALSVLGDILGGGMSSRLFQRVRDQLGAAYYVRAEDDLFTDHGLFSVSAGLDNARAPEVIEAILDELKKISSKAVSAEELKRSKNHLTGEMILGLETSVALANFYGGQEIYHKEIKTPQEIIEEIRKVTAGEILAVAKDIVKNQHLNLAIIGPFKDKKPFEKILKI